MLGLPLRVRASSIFQAAEQDLEAVAALVATLVLLDCASERF